MDTFLPPLPELVVQLMEWPVAVAVQAVQEVVVATTTQQQQQDQD